MDGRMEDFFIYVVCVCVCVCVLMGLGTGLPMFFRTCLQVCQTFVILRDTPRPLVVA